MSKRSLGLGATYLGLAVWLVFTLFPIGWVYISSLKTPEDAFALPPRWVFRPTFYNFEVLFGLKVSKELEGATRESIASGRSRFPKYFVNSVITSLSTTLCTLTVGSLAAWGLARFRTRWRRPVLQSILMTRMIPPVVLLIPVYILLRNIKLLDTRAGLILTYIAINLPFAIWMLYGFFQAIPAELEEAAQVDGASRMGAFLRVLLPLTAPGLGATAIFVMIQTWNEFLYATMLTNEAAKTLSPAITGFITDKAILWGQLYAAGATVMLPVLVFSLAVQKHLARGLTMGGVKG